MATHATPARDTVQAYLSAQALRLAGLETLARAGDDDGVHQMRVAARRLRATLRSCRSLLDPEPAEALRADLRWLGEALGAVRDAQVQHRRLAVRLGQQPPDLVVGPVGRRVAGEMQTRLDVGRARLDAALDDARFAALTTALDRLAGRAPMLSEADGPAEELVPRIVGRQARKVRRRSSESAEAGDPDPGLHEVRKAAKSARYAAELVSPVAHRPARRLARRMKALQDVLGEHQDAVTAVGLLRELAVAARSSGEDGFTYGLLISEELAAARAARQRYPTALRRATSKKATRWTT